MPETLRANQRTITCRLSSDLADRLAAVAERTHRTKSFYLRQLLLDHIEDLEDLADSIEAVEQPGRRWTADELRQELEREAAGRKHTVAR